MDFPDFGDGKPERERERERAIVPGKNNQEHRLIGVDSAYYRFRDFARFFVRQLD